MTAPQPDMTDLITTTAAARLLKVHLQSLYRWIRQGRLNAWRVGDRLRLSRREVEAFAQAVPRPTPQRWSPRPARNGPNRHADLDARGW